MSKKAKKTKTLGDKTIALNRKARHDYFIKEQYEAGLILEGWEVKSMRAGRVQLAESYIIFKKGEAWLLGSHITPLTSASTHIVAIPDRTRKLLLHKKELNRLCIHVVQKGFTVVPLALYWKKGRVKLEIGLAQGKKQHDKRADIKEKDWNREKARVLKSNRYL